MPRDTAGSNVGDWALFLDVDGTLLEIADTPQSVRVSTRLLDLLGALQDRLQGALALVSGRSLADLDRLFAPLALCASGTHGCEFRDPEGAVTQPDFDRHVLSPARAQLLALAGSEQGLLLEDKGHGLAMHYRLAPALEPTVRSLMESLVRGLGEAFTLQAGKCVYEIRPTRWTKGNAIERYMQRPPFVGRKPLFIGDDITDEHGFAVVNSLGGVTVKVGSAVSTLARHRVSDVTAVLDLLERLPRLVLQEERC
jgi:trehalose 6-phosphate phosphatase